MSATTRAALASVGPALLDSPFASAINSAATSRSATPTSGGREVSLSKWWKEAPEVKMPAALRELVEETIRDMMTKFPTTLAAGLDQDEDDLDPVRRAERYQPTVEEVRVMTTLLNTGFRRGHVVAALDYLRAAAAAPIATRDPLLASLAALPLLAGCYEYLHLHVPEEDMPVEFKLSKPADAAARIATSADSDELRLNWLAERLAKNVGVPLTHVQALLRDEAQGDEGVALDLLLRRLMGRSSVSAEARLGEAALLQHVAVLRVAPPTAEATAELDERRRDEVLGLEGIFGDRFRTVEGGLEVLISAPTLRQNQIAADQLVLRVLWHPFSLYPSPTDSADDALHLPTFYLFSSTLPAYIVLHLTHLLAVQVVAEAGLDLAKQGFGGVIMEIVNHADEIWKHVVDNPPDARVVALLLSGGPKVAITAAPSVASNTVKNRPRTRAYQPPATPAQQLALAQHLVANSLKPAYRKMESIRAKLPAWEMRDQIVNLIKNNRVVIVSGETGSGKTTQVPSFVRTSLAHSLAIVGLSS